MAFGLRLGLGWNPNEGQRSNGHGIMYGTIRPGPKVQWAWGHTPYSCVSHFSDQKEDFSFVYI